LHLVDRAARGGARAVGLVASAHHRAEGTVLDERVPRIERELLDVGGDLAAFGAGLADGVVWSEAALPADLGKAEALDLTATLWNGFSDLRRTVETAWAAGDYVVATGRMTGTNDGPLANMQTANTGKTVDATFIEIARFVGGKVDRSWLFYNGIVLAEQLGLAGPG
jgi:ketosteroid isomerase-like protein